jgi:hypothetical protein
MNHIKKAISLTKVHDKCEMCGIHSYSLWFLWEGLLTDTKVKVCRKCAYKEEFGTKGQIKAKKNKVLEKKFVEANL